jgi:lysophospholipase L1-like esterase
MDWYESEVRDLEARLCGIATETPPVVFYGSSSIRLWGTLAEDFPDVPVVNCGFGGSTLEACAWLFARLVRPLSPAAFVLYAGDNDLGDGRAPTFVLEQLASLLRQLDELSPQVPAALLAIKPSPARWGIREQIERTNAGFRAAAEQRPRTRYVDVYAAMLHGGNPRRELFAEDGLHLSEAGYNVWREVLQQARSGIF